MARQGPKRTASTSGKSRLQNPQPFWRYFLGGRISSPQALTTDIDGDGQPEVVLCVAGTVAARNAATDQQVWTNTETECSELKGLHDLDGDGTQELVLRSLGQIFVLRLSDGNILWREPRGEMGTIGALLIGELDGSPGLELVVQECGCCSVNSGNSGYAYSFAGQGASLQKPRQLWEMPPITCGANRATALVHMREAAQTEIVFADRFKISLLDGKTGKLFQSTGNLGDNMNASRCIGMPSTSNAREDVLCLLNSPSATVGSGRRLFVLRSTTNGLAVVWDRDIGEQDARVVAAPGFIADFDNDGELEIMVSGEDALSQPITQILRAQDGSTEAELPGEKALGSFQVTPSGQRLLFTEQDGTLSAWKLASSGNQRLQRQWARKGRQPASYVAQELNARTILRSRLVSFDFNGDGSNELILQDPQNENFFEVIDPGTTNPTLLGSYQAPKEDMVSQVWPVASSGAGLGQLLIAQSSGNLHLLDNALNPLSGNRSFGVRFAGYYSSAEFRQLRDTPVVAELEAGQAGLLVTNSRGQLLRLETQTASFSSPPQTRWAVPKTNAAMIVPAVLPTESGIVAVDNSEPNSAVVSIAADGSERWRNPLAGVVLADLVWGRLNDDGVQDVVVQYGLSSNLVTNTRAIDGRDGSTLWEALPYNSTNRQPSGGSMADWNGDGFDDFVFQQTATRVIDGRSGIEILASGMGPSYAMPILFDTSGDGSLEVTRIASDQGPATLSHDLTTTIWQGDSALRAFNYGGIVRCQGLGPQLIHGSLERPSELIFVETAGANAGQNNSRILADGQIFPDQASADQAAAIGGQLSSPVVHRNLAGTGRAVVLVGSRDGWLYGLDACNRELQFAYEFSAPVGSIALGDSDGDGWDEILVSVADGYLYAFKNAVIEAPQQVLDIDPGVGAGDQDVDVIQSKDVLHGSWSAVAGAESYEVAIVRSEKDGGGIISPQGWLNVGNVTRASISSLPLVVGQLYFFAVRAKAGAERSPESLSDGVVVQEEAAANEPGTDLLVGRSWLYCAASAAPNNGHAFPFGLGLIAWLLRRRKRPNISQRPPKQRR